MPKEDITDRNDYIIRLHNNNNNNNNSNNNNVLCI